MARPSRSDIRKTSVGEEVTFGTPVAGDYYPMKSGLPDLTSLTQDYLEKDEVRSGDYVEPGIIGSKANSTLSADYHVHPFSQTPPLKLPIPADVYPDIMVMANAIGEVYTDPTVVPNDPPTMSAYAAPDLTVSAVLGLTPGLPIMIELTDGTFEPSVIRSIVGTVLTLSAPTQGVPAHATGGKIYSTMCVFPTDTPQHNSLTHSVMTAVPDGIGTFMEAEMVGCQATSYKLSWTAREFASQAIDYAVADWDWTSGADLPVREDYGRNRVTVLGGRMYYYDPTTADQGCLALSSFEFTKGMDSRIPDQLCDDAVQGVGENTWGFSNPTVTIDPLFNSDFIDVFSGGRDVQLTFMIGEVPGKAIIFHARKAYLTVDPISGDRDGLATSPMTFSLTVNDDDGTSGTYEKSDTFPIDCPYVIGVG